MQPFVSIIVPTFNRANLIAETLDSIIAQSYQNWECIIVDDGSNDNTAEIVAKYNKSDSRFSFVKRPNSKPKGGNACRNYGFELSKGTIINWMDSDDLMLPNHLTIHIEKHLAQNVDAVVTGAKVFRDSKENIIRNWSETKPTGDLISQMIWNEVLWQTNCVTWKRNCIPELPFDEKLASSQEWTFHLRQMINKRTYLVDANDTCLIRNHEQRIGGNISEAVNFSTFASRRAVRKFLIEKNLLNQHNEKGLLKYIFTALRQALHFGHYKLALTIVKYLSEIALKSDNRGAIARVILVAAPVFGLSGKGEKLFKIS